MLNYFFIHYKKNISLQDFAEPMYHNPVLACIVMLVLIPAVILLTVFAATSLIMLPFSSLMGWI